MLRIRTFFQGYGVKFVPKSLNFTYGNQSSVEETQYGVAVGYDSMTTLDQKNFYVLNGGSAYATNEATISFKTTQPNQKVTIEIRASSQTGDYMCAGQLDSNSITKAAVKVSGSQRQTYTYTVPAAGNHYIKFFFRNDASGTGGNNKGYFRLQSFTNTVSGLVGLSKTVEVRALSSWVLYSKPDWVTKVSPTSGEKGRLTATITVNPNYGNTRSGNIVVQEQKKKELYTLPVTQDASPSTLKLSNNYVVNNDDAASNTISVALTGTSTSWSATNTSSEWYSISPTSGKSGDNVTITWKANTGTGRTAQSVFTGNNGGTDTLTLSQETHICSCDCQNYCACDCNNVCSCDCNTVCNCDCNSVCSCDCNTVCTCDCNSYCSCDCNSYCTCDCNNYCYRDYSGDCNCDCYSYCSGDYSNDCTCDCNNHCSSDYSNKCNCDCNTYCKDYSNACTCDCNSQSITSCPTQGCYNVAHCQCQGVCICDCNQVCTRDSMCTIDSCSRDFCTSDFCHSDLPIMCQGKTTCATNGCAPNCIGHSCPCDGTDYKCSGETFCTTDGCTDCGGQSYCSTDGCRNDCASQTFCTSDGCSSDCSKSYCNTDGCSDCYSQSHCSSDGCSSDCSGESYCGSHGCTNDCHSESICNVDGCSSDCKSEQSCSCDNYQKVS